MRKQKYTTRKINEDIQETREIERQRKIERIAKWNQLEFKRKNNKNKMNGN